MSVVLGQLTKSIEAKQPQTRSTSSAKHDPSPVRGEVNVDELLLRSYRRAHELKDIELVGFLKHNLGRPLIARITKTSDPNTVSRWSNGRARPEPETWARMRSTAAVLFAVAELVGSDSSAADWLTGKNPSLGFVMPAIALSEGRDDEVYAAVREIAQW